MPLGQKAGIARAVEPLVGEPGLGLLCAVCLHPFLVRGARGHVVHYVQEVVPGRLDEHNAPLLLRSQNAVLLG